MTKILKMTILSISKKFLILKSSIITSVNKKKLDIIKIKIRFNDFQKYFLVAYATTIHSAQGLSIGKNYTIHEWNRLDERLKYVSLSRARNYENIHIME